MHIEIRFDDGRTRRIDCSLQGEYTGTGYPGIQVAFTGLPMHERDFFETSMTDGGMIGGRVDLEAADYDDGPGDTLVPRFEAFDWRLVGTPEDECRLKLSRWLVDLGRFDPSEEEPTGLATRSRMAYRRDRQCWQTYLDDPGAELDAIDRPPAPAGPGI